LANVKKYDELATASISTEKNLLNMFREWSKIDRCSISDLVTDAMVIYARVRSKKEGK